MTSSQLEAAIQQVNYNCGDCDVEVRSRLEYGYLLKNIETCEKNKDHAKFYPITKLQLSHLPENFQDKKVLGWITSASKLTGCLILKSKDISKDRPEKWQGTETSYPLHDARELDSLSFGSGYVVEISEPKDEICKCKQCKESGKQERMCGEIHVQTARHVIYDLGEAYNCEFTLFNTEENVNSDRIKVVYGLHLGECYREEDDRCVVVCAVHDRELLDELNELKTRYEEAQRQVYDSEYNAEGRNLAVVISHPHGCAQQVTIGSWKDRTLVGEGDMADLTRYKYDACTCPGSSGAPVFILGRKGTDKSSVAAPHPHAKGPKPVPQPQPVPNPSSLPNPPIPINPPIPLGPPNPPTDDQWNESGVGYDPIHNS